MQPLHDDLRCPAAKHNSITHAAATPSKLHATITLRAAAALHGKPQGFVPRLSPQHKPHETFMQPLQCVLQHHVANPIVSSHHFCKSPLPLVTTSLSHHPSSPPFVPHPSSSPLPPHFPESPPFVLMYCYVM